MDLSRLQRLANEVHEAWLELRTNWRKDEKGAERYRKLKATRDLFDTELAQVVEWRKAYGHG